MNSSTRRLLVIPAAGLGSRLATSVAKGLVPVAGRPMVDWLLDRYASFVGRAVVITSPQMLPVFEDHFRRTGAQATCVVQPEPTGMLPAIRCAAPAIIREAPDEVWITWCDQIGISGATASRLAETLEDASVACALPTVLQVPPYIHFGRDGSGRIAEVLQRREGDAMPPRGESDAGLFGMRGTIFQYQLEEYSRIARPASGTRELNFLPFLPWLAARAVVRTFPLRDPREALGVNTPEDLRQMEAFLRERD